jgi:hypothetical protein
MNRRLTFLAAAVVLADLLALGAVWHVSPTLSLTVGLVVPEVEQILSPLYPDPIREEVASGDLHRPVRPRATLVLTADPGRQDARSRRVARALARRDVAVVLPASPATVDASVAYARSLGIPVRVESVASFEHDDGRSTIATRAAYAWRLLRLSHALLTAR